MKFVYDYLPFIWARKNVEMPGRIIIIKMIGDIFYKYYSKYSSAFAFGLKRSTIYAIIVWLKIRVATVGLFCWNIWKHILKSTVAFLNLSNCQGQADICENWNWHFLSKFIDDIKTKTVFLLFLYNILPYIMASSFQHLKAPSCEGDDGHWTSLVPYRRPIAAVRRGRVGELKLSPSCHF